MPDVRVWCVAVSKVKQGHVALLHTKMCLFIPFCDLSSKNFWKKDVLAGQLVRKFTDIFPTLLISNVYLLIKL